jgi:hypothetical protein
MRLPPYHDLLSGHREIEPDVIGDRPAGGVALGDLDHDMTAGDAVVERLQLAGQPLDQGPRHRRQRQVPRADLQWVLHETPPFRPTAVSLSRGETSLSPG